VGTFEGGATPSGVYDLIGNAREWVTVDQLGVLSVSPAAAMGGSWLSHQEPLFSFKSSTQASSQVFGLRLASLEVDPRHRSIDLGFRLAANAEEYLLRTARSCGSSQTTRARARAVGARWGQPAVELLRELSDEAEVIRWLLEGAEQ